MLSHGGIIDVALLCNWAGGEDSRTAREDVHIGHLPEVHVLELMLSWSFLCMPNWQFFSPDFSESVFIKKEPPSTGKEKKKKAKNKSRLTPTLMVAVLGITDQIYKTMDEKNI
jgi:hypothetical protein